MEISGKVALVTGGAGGLGEATVRRLAAEGAKVVIADLSDDKGAKLAADLGGAASYARTDVTDEASVNAALDVAAGLGELRLVVNSHGGPVAGMRLLQKDGAPMPQELFDWTVSPYVSGTFQVLRLAASRMASLDPMDSGVRGSSSTPRALRRSRVRSDRATTARRRPACTD